jgi:hypothetical protein
VAAPSSSTSAALDLLKKQQALHSSQLQLLGAAPVASVAIPRGQRGASRGKDPESVAYIRCVWRGGPGETAACAAVSDSSGGWWGPGWGGSAGAWRGVRAALQLRGWFSPCHPTAPTALLPAACRHGRRCRQPTGAAWPPLPPPVLCRAEFLSAWQQVQEEVQLLLSELLHAPLRHWRTKLQDKVRPGVGWGARAGGLGIGVWGLGLRAVDRFRVAPSLLGRPVLPFCVACVACASLQGCTPHPHPHPRSLAGTPRPLLALGPLTARRYGCANPTPPPPPRPCAAPQAAGGWLSEFAELGERALGLAKDSKEDKAPDQTSKLSFSFEVGPWMPWVRG